MSFAEKSKLEKVADWLLLVVGVGMVLYHIISTQYLLQGHIEHQDTHLGFALVLVFLGALQNIRGGRAWFVRVIITTLLLGASILATVYIRVELPRLDEIRGMPTMVDMVIGVILALVVLEATRRSWGPVLPLISTTVILYAFFGHLLTGPLYHPYMEPSYVISYLGIGLEGVFGSTLTASADYIFLFVIFGSLFVVVGVIGFLQQLGTLASRVLAGGPGHTAVIASSLVGSCVMAAVANVALTGSFTIPMMKRVGYTPEQAGAIEATASTGGQIMPPVMGSSAFLMAVIVGVPYVTIMLAGVIPAILYYVSVGLGVQVIAKKAKIARLREAVETKTLLRIGPVFLIPLLVIIVLLLMRYSPMYAAFYAIVVIMALGYIQKDTRPTLSGLVQRLAEGALVGAKIAVALACIGIIAKIMTLTGLGIKMAMVVEWLSGGQVIVALILTMLLSIILGCGLPTPAAYLIVAIVVVPILVGYGVGLLPAHFFVFYFAIISALTPPVALAALAGAGLAGGSYFRTAWESCKLAIAGFIIPYALISNPWLLLASPVEPVYAATVLVAMLLGCAALTAGIYGHLQAPCHGWQRSLLVMAALCLFGYVLVGTWILFIAGASLSVSVLGWRHVKGRSKRKEI